MADAPKTLTKQDREARARRMAEEGERAAAEYASAIEARDENIKRLRALRLAREATEQPAPAAPVRAPKKKVIRRVAR